MAGRPRKIAAEFAEYSTRDAILIAAEELCGEQGPSGFKLREIARRVGIEPASIYNHFQGLGGVLSTLINESLAEEEELLTLPSEMRGEAAIRELILRTTRYFSARKGIVRLSLNDFAEVHEQVPNAFDVNEAQIIRILDLESALLADHLGLGKLGRRRLGEIATCHRAMVFTLLSMTWLNRRETDEARVQDIASLVSAFILGLPSQYE